MTYFTLKDLKDGEIVLRCNGQQKVITYHASVYKWTYSILNAVFPIYVNVGTWKPVDEKGFVEINWCGTCGNHKMHISQLSDDTQVSTYDGPAHLWV